MARTVWQPGAPVDRGGGPVGEARLQQLQEDDLVPLDVLGVVAADLPPPVVDGPERDDRLLQLGDPGVGEDPGVGAGLDGGVLRRQAERVEAERGQHGLTQHGAVADQQVAEGVVADVAHVGGPRRVGVHGQDVGRGARIVGVHLVGALVGPALLPFLLDFDDVVGPCHGSRWYRGASRPRCPCRPGAEGSVDPCQAASPGSATMDIPSWRRVRVARPDRCSRGIRPVDCVPSGQLRGRSSAGRALDWQSRGSWVRVPSPPLCC